MEIGAKQITNPQFEGVDSKDYPDFCDAFMVSCDIDGEEATEDQLEYINEFLLGDFWDEIYQSLIP